MHFYWILVLCFVGALGFNIGGSNIDFIEEEIDNLSDSSDDILIRHEEYENNNVRNSMQSISTEMDDSDKRHVFADPKVYGMNIGLHFILEDINRRLASGGRVHVESLIKVLVLTHNIEKVGGMINESNMVALKHMIGLYPASLRNALIS